MKPNNYDAIDAVIRQMEKYTEYKPTFAYIPMSMPLPEGTIEKDFTSVDLAIDFAKANGITNVVLRVGGGRIILCYKEQKVKI